MKHIIHILLLGIFSVSVSADRLVFVQGYLGESSNWRASGIIKHLEKKGWRQSGHYYYHEKGLSLKQAPVTLAKNQYYTVELPSEASITDQAYFLSSYLKHLRKNYPKERLILVGHSAGGVLSRFVMVQNPELKVAQLITISSPHLGSDLAELANLVGKTPFAIFTPLIGAETLNRSQALYQDLLPEQPGRFLYELNRQPHPDAEYISIVRNPNAADGGDLVVPAYSHDMRNVYSLSRQARSYVVNGGHSLNARDGLLIYDILTQHTIKESNLGQRNLI